MMRQTQLTRRPDRAPPWRAPLTGEHAVVRINDRGPASSQVVTPSFAATNRLGLPEDGAIQVGIRFLGMTAPDKIQTRYAAR